MNPVTTMIDSLWEEQNRRHAWLTEAAEKVRRWKAEDAANGMPWDEDTCGMEAAQQGRGGGNVAPSNQ